MQNNMGWRNHVNTKAKKPEAKGARKPPEVKVVFEPNREAPELARSLDTVDQLAELLRKVGSQPLTAFVAVEEIPVERGDAH